jgi:toluene monooxygenase system protein E
MTNGNPKPRRRRTWSAFGDIKKVPSDYEVVTHGTNWTLRAGRTAPFEQNPSSPANLWFVTYRENSKLQADDWDGYRDPDAVTYRNYVTAQDEAETKVAGLLDEYSSAGTDGRHAPGWRAMLATVFAPSRYPVHGAQQIEAYIGHMAPSSYITNAAAFTTSDQLRRVSLLSYRTRELQRAWPDEGFAAGERSRWENDPAWQGVRKVIEQALITYDWAEAFTALNLVLLPTLDDALLTQFRQLARDNGDELTWLLLSSIEADSRRRDRWSGALARFAVEDRPGNAGVLQAWIDKWAPRADAGVEGLAPLFESLPENGRSAAEVVTSARQARQRFHEGAGLVPAGLAASS